jgi:hypothetical protein
MGNPASCGIIERASKPRTPAEPGDRGHMSRVTLLAEVFLSKL